MSFIGVKLEMWKKEVKMDTYDSDVILLDGDDDDVLFLGIKPKIIETITLDQSEAENNSGEESEEENEVEEKKIKEEKRLGTDGNEADDEAEDYEDSPSPRSCPLHRPSSTITLDDEPERDEIPPSPPHHLPGPSFYGRRI